MTHEERAVILKRVIWITLIAIAAGAGLMVDLFSGSRGGDDAQRNGLRQVTKENFKEVINKDHCLTVMNVRLDGEPNSEKLAEILAELEKNQTYGDQVEVMEIDATILKEVGEEEIADLKQFAGQLNFYAKGEKLGSLKGVSDRAAVKKEIDSRLRGLIARYGPGWLPTVEGMKRVNSEELRQKILPTAPSAQPGNSAPPSAPVQRPAPQSDLPPGMQRIPKGS